MGQQVNTYKVEKSWEEGRTWEALNSYLVDATKNEKRELWENEKVRKWNILRYLLLNISSSIIYLIHLQKNYTYILIVLTFFVNEKKHIYWKIIRTELIDYEFMITILQYIIIYLSLFIKDLYIYHVFKTFTNNNHVFSSYNPHINCINFLIDTSTEKRFL